MLASSATIFRPAAVAHSVAPCPCSLSHAHNRTAHDLVHSATAPQLLSKMRQVEVLKSQLEKAAMAGEIKSANIHAQEAIIRVLQQQHDAEKGAKLKAQHALQDKEQVRLAIGSLLLPLPFTPPAPSGRRAAEEGVAARWPWRTSVRGYQSNAGSQCALTPE